ncbi:MAG: hypothetical protein RLZZ347_244 [Candidatus Parcubacteria bacterium]|jgi:adenylate kinase family enzyme
MAHAHRPVTSASIIYRPGLKTALIKCGPPGCGKGTQTEYLKKELGIATLEMGPHLKAILKNDPAFGNGALIGDDTVRYHLKLWVHRNIGARHIVIDGCPRTADQVSLISFLKDRGYKVATIWFDTPAEVCVQRLLANPRPGRAEDLSLETTTRRAEDYRRVTLPIRERVLEMSDAHLTIDNTNLSKEMTRAMVLRFASEHMQDHESVTRHAEQHSHILAGLPHPQVVEVTAP